MKAEGGEGVPGQHLLRHEGWVEGEGGCVEGVVVEDGLSIGANTLHPTPLDGDILRLLQPRPEQSLAAGYHVGDVRFGR